MKQTSINDDLILNIPGYFYVKNKNLQYTQANKNYINLLGLKNLSNILGKKDIELSINNIISEEFSYDDYRVITEGVAASKVYIFSRTQQFKTHISWEKQFILDELGQPKSILAFGIDVSNIQRKLEEMEKQKNLLEDIIYNLPGYIYWKNINSQYVLFNKHVLEISKLNKHELYGKTDAELNWGREQAENFIKEDQAVLAKGEISTTELQIPVKRSDGNTIIIRTEKTRLHDRSGKIMGVLGVAMDVTEQKLLEKQLEKSEFLRNMEHDIRTPFSGIYSLAEILEEEEQDTDKKIMISAIKLCAQELLDYCNGILEYSKIEAKSFIGRNSRFNLKESVKKIIAMEKPAAMSKHLAITFKYPSNVPKFFISDQVKIEKLLLNLIGNAVKFTEKGSVKVKIAAVRELNHNILVLRIYVEDTGIGIPDEKKDYIFETFAKLSASNTNKYKGAGLGLAVVKCLIKELQGEIEVQSEIGKGTTFICTLPLQLALVHDEPST